MNTFEEITLDMLNSASVSVKRQKCFVDDIGETHEYGLPHRKSYINSEAGRAELEAELEEPYLSAVLEVWGDEPIIL